MQPPRPLPRRLPPARGARAEGSGARAGSCCRLEKGLGLIGPPQSPPLPLSAPWGAEGAPRCLARSRGRLSINTPRQPPAPSVRKPELAGRDAAVTEGAPSAGAGSCRVDGDFGAAGPGPHPALPPRPAAEMPHAPGDVGASRWGERAGAGSGLWINWAWRCGGRVLPAFCPSLGQDAASPAPGAGSAASRHRQQPARHSQGEAAWHLHVVQGGCVPGSLGGLRRRCRSDEVSPAPRFSLSRAWEPAAALPAGPLRDQRWPEALRTAVGVR